MSGYIIHTKPEVCAGSTWSNVSSLLPVACDVFCLTIVSLNFHRFAFRWLVFCGQFPRCLRMYWNWRFGTSVETEVQKKGCFHVEVIAWQCGVCLVMCSSSSYLGCYHTLVDRTYDIKLVTAYCAVLVLSCLEICAFAKYHVDSFCVCVKSTHGP